MSLPGIGGAIAAAVRPSPILRGSVQTSQQASGGTFAVALPTHATGDVLVVVCAYKGDAPVSASAGWTEVIQQANVQSNDGGIAVYRRTAAGAGTSLTVTNGNSQAICSHAYALQFAQGSVSASYAIGSDPPSHTPSWTVANDYWIVANETTDNAPTAGPSGFGNSVQTNPSGSLYLSTLDTTSDVATLDPGTFNNTSANVMKTISLTIAVRPA